MFKVCFFLITFQILALLVLYALTPKTNATLKLVQTLFRHGERSPTKSFTNDPYKDYQWPGGFNQLTSRGKVQEYELGLKIRKRYEDFLPNIYKLDDIHVQSSEWDRCIMSAQLLLAGLYPPVDEQIWNSRLLWQPIPVYYIPRSLDNKIAIKKPCTAFDNLLKLAYNSTKIREINANNSDLYDYLSKHTGDEIRNVRSLETLYNTLEIEELNDLKLPEWTNSVFPDSMKDLAALSLALFTDTMQMKRLHGGMLLKSMIDNMQQKKEGTLNPNRMMFLYSGHDLTIVSLLRVMGFHELIKPNFGASVHLEFHQINEDYFVRIFYKNSPNDDATELILQDCDGACEFDLWKNLLHDAIPNNWEKECGN